MREIEKFIAQFDDKTLRKRIYHQMLDVISDVVHSETGKYQGRASDSLIQFRSYFTKMMFDEEKEKKDE